PCGKPKRHCRPAGCRWKRGIWGIWGEPGARRNALLLRPGGASILATSSTTGPAGRWTRGGPARAQGFHKGGCLMKTMLKVSLAVAVAVVLVLSLKAADDVTKTGKLVCGKCT